MPREIGGMTRSPEIVEDLVQSVAMPVRIGVGQQADLERFHCGLLEELDPAAFSGSLGHQQAVPFQMQQGGINGITPDPEFPGQPVSTRHPFAPCPLSDFVAEIGGNLFRGTENSERIHLLKTS